MIKILLAFSLFLSGSSQAARIISVVATPHFEGQVTDYETVAVRVMMERDQPSVRLVLRAFLINAENSARLTPISRALTATNREARPFVAEVVVEFPKSQAGEALESPVGVVDQSFRIALDDLALPDGVQSVGLVATTISLNNEERLFEMASSIQKITVDGKIRIVSDRAAVAANQAIASVEAKVVRADGTYDDVGTVNAFPANEPEGSVSAEAWEAQVEARAKENPQELAGVRKDVPQHLAKKEELVYFATNRKILSVKGQQFKFKYLAEVRAKGVAGLTWGAVSLDLPTREQEQSWWSSAKAELVKTYIYSEKNFLERISNADSPSSSKDVLFYIHGYNNSFEDTVLQAGRMKRDLRFAGNVMAYSWPSVGDWKWYSSDQAMADDEGNREAVDHVLEQVVMRAKSQGGRVFVLGHSMGNRLLVHALRKLYLKRGTELAGEEKEDRTLSLVAFAAPDVNLDNFSSVLPSTVAISNMVSFYYSTKDRALWLSSGIHKMNRAGLHPVFHDDVGTINLDKLNGWFSMGHCTYSSSDRAILDLYLQIRYHCLPPNRVPPLEEDVEGEKKLLFKHWFLNP